VFPTSVLPGALIVLAGGVAICWLQQQGPANGLRLIEFFVLVWAVDCGSFFAGRRWGRHKLAAALSPGKTIQGALGGAVSLLVVSGCIYLLDDSLAETMLLTWLSVTVAVYLMCVVGDLYESAAKRNAGVKDSGTLLPGHGGILDRVDSVIAASPIYYIVLFW
jgi:phosphatidate cytidylyltransferase